MTLPERHQDDAIGPPLTGPPPHKVLSVRLRRLMLAGSVVCLITSQLLHLIGLTVLDLPLLWMGLLLIAQLLADSRYRAGWADRHQAGRGGM